MGSDENPDDTQRAQASMNRLQPLIFSFLRIVGGVMLGVFLFVGGIIMFENQFIYFPNHEKMITPEVLAKPWKTVWLTAKDGTKLHAWWIGDSSHQATVLFLQGNAGNISHRLHRLQFLGDLPARFFLLDYRGYGQSEGTPSEKGLYEDAEAAYTYLRDRIEPKQIVLYGESLGGAVAIEIAHRFPVAGVILESTFTSLKEMAKVYFPIIPTFLISQKFASIDKVAMIAAPKLFIHGHRDSIVPFAIGKELFEKALQPKSFLEIPEADHNDLYVVGGPKYVEAIKTFLQDAFSP